MMTPTEAGPVVSDETTSMTVCVSPQLSVLEGWLPGTPPCVCRVARPPSILPWFLCVRAENLSLCNLTLRYTTSVHDRDLTALYKRAKSTGPCLMLLHAQVRTGSEGLALSGTLVHCPSRWLCVCLAC